MKNHYLGIDTATVNAGYAILTVTDNSMFVSFSETHKTPEKMKTSDFIKATFQVDRTRAILSKIKFKAIALEAPALASSNLAVGIGMVHGALLSAIRDSHSGTCYYIPPTKWKYALVGGGRAEKSTSLTKVLDNFKFSNKALRGKFDHNQAEAILLAYSAYVFDCFENNITPFYLPDTESRLNEIFYSNKPTKKPSGIIHRPDVFFFKF